MYIRLEKQVLSVPCSIELSFIRYKTRLKFYTTKFLWVRSSVSCTALKELPAFLTQK